MKNYRDLIVWQKAHKNVLQIYKLTKTLPKEEQFGITSQIRRAATLYLLTLQRDAANSLKGILLTFCRMLLAHAWKLSIYPFFPSNSHSCRKMNLET